MGARLKKLSLALALAMALSGSTAVAATKKPTPQPTVKATTKATAKATTKATVKPTSKVSVKPSAKPTSTAKTTAKPAATGKTSASPTATSTSKATVKPKPKPKPKRKPRKKIKVSPSPKPIWPPVGFTPESGIYAKVPTSKELVGVISAKGNLATQVAACTKFVCGAVQVAAEQGCLWWEIDSKVYSPNKELLGELKTLASITKSREFKTILLISPEPLDTREYVDSIEIACHQEARPDGLQSVTYTKVG